MANSQIAVSILILLFISATGDSIAEPQNCNVFIGCQVTIIVCHKKCRHRYRGSREICITSGPPRPVAPLQLSLSTKVQRKGGDSCACRCVCSFPKAPNQTCPKNVTTMLN